MKANNSLIAETKLGQIKGKLVNKVGIFYGVPYAKNPFTKKRRFQAPIAIEPWKETLDATAITPPVPQPGRGTKVELVGRVGDLTVNVWAPLSAMQADNKVPVMVWIPGGAFIREDAAERVYDGRRFAEQGVVVVTVNYRVGVDGFMHLKGAPDNRGILDQILALRWVRDNIQDFGGDPRQVTLFGQSAGAGSVAILLGSPKASGLYHKAIMQSPPMQAMTRTQATKVTTAFAKQHNVKATMSGISNIPLSQLVTGVVDMGNAITDRTQWGMLSWGGTAFLPVIDGDVIQISPMADLMNNGDASIPVIVGSTDQESRLYLVPDGTIDRITEDELSLFLKDLHLGCAASEVYGKAGNVSFGDIYAQAQSDYTFRMPALHIAERLSLKGNPVWKYNFAWQSPAYNGRLGAAHFVDVPFTFNTLDSQEAKDFVGTQPPDSLTHFMQTQWLHFAKTDSVDWPSYSQDVRATMQFNIKSKVMNDPNKDVRRLWQNYSF
ncbi:carboxylesterase family protein [Alteromonas sp. CI.11.F.A3]|uniref:carboxylesterase/lipase family protein n=1 Tax=Alteromonas sp. CI.11.F.A3 TaxID=3079555 RepID=UPI002942D152|nr:carboxylesterase family protein [Alteromonas sp. CI.11.F.A3]WOI36355.1 carboxylesterase family protein [Alteromonas sp. CI.11.F.A3]